MELMKTDLRKAIGQDSRFNERNIQFSVAQQIAAGMNFLHSLNPYVLVKTRIYLIIFKINYIFQHRDLRTPNVLVNENLEKEIIL